MGKTVCIFAGQGAQAPGMGRELAGEGGVSSLFDRAGSVLGFDLAKICFEGPAEELMRSDICQPAIFTVSVAAFHAFRQKCPNLTFAMAGGLSLGEWSALHIAGVLDFDATLQILQARGRYMQEACETNPGGMISIMGASEEQLAIICSQSGAMKANINSDAQVVLSGTREQVAAAAEAAGGLGVKAVELKVAGAFHSPLMLPAREKMADFIKDIPFKAPTMPVLANVTGQPHGSDPAAIKEAMLRQITDSVQWLACVRYAINAGASDFVEFGPGKVLSGLIKRIDGSVGTLNVQDSASLERTAQKLTDCSIRVIG